MWFQMILGSLIFASVLFLQTAVADKCTMWSFEDNKDDNLNNSSASMDIGSVTSITECSLQGISFIKSKVNAYEMNYLLQYDSSQSTAIYKVDGDKYVGKNYVAMTYYGANMVGQIHIAATSSGSTNVKIDLPDLLNFTAPKCTVNYEGKDYINGETIKLTIDQNETVTIKGQCDLTGTFIKGEEKIAVFSGSYTNESSSLSFEQLMPYRMSSTYYILHAYSGVDCENIISVATYVSNTILKISGYDYIIIPRKRQQVRRKIEKNESVYIKSSKPISVMQYIICEHDNAMILVSPIQQDLERKRSLSATCHATKISVPDSNFFTNRYVIDSNYSVDIVDKSGMVYSQYGLFGDGHKIGGSIFDTTFKWKKSVMVPGDGIDNDGDGEIDEDECGDPGDGLDCGKLRYGNTRDQDRTFFIAYSTMDQATDIFSDCDVNNTWYGFAIEIISSYGCSVVLNTNINVGGRSIHLNYSLLPVDVLDQEYYAFTKCSSDSLTFMCNVTAISNATTIEIKGLEKHTIHAYDTYVLNNETDLSGTFIRANNPVSVVCICIEDSDDDITINTMQLPPVDTWGKQFKFTLLPRNDMDKGQIFCTASTGNTVVIVKIYRGYMDNTITEYVYSKSIFLNIAGDIEGFDFERDTLYSIVAYKAIMVTLVFKLDKNISTVFVTPTEQITDSTNGSNVYTVKIDGFEFRQPFNNYLNIANNFDSINKPFTVTEQTPRDDIDNDGDGLVDEDYCLFLLGDSGLMDLDFDGSYNEDCHGCDAGNELNTAFLTCEQCKIGFYRDGSNKIDKCKPCQFNYTTFFVGSVSADSCIHICDVGYELNKATESCIPCQIGYFKNVTSDDSSVDPKLKWKCTYCGVNKTTYSTGSTSSEECIDSCESGYQLAADNKTCEKCPRNTSKNDASIYTRCKPCPLNQITMSDGSEICVDLCRPGFEFNNNTKNCQPCKLGFSKREEGNFENCIECGTNSTTKSEGQTECVPASCKCPCNRVHPVVNYTSAELSKVIEQLKKELKVNKEKLSSTLRRKTSVKDNRPSSKTFGAFSITVIVAVFLLFLIFDFVMIKHHVQIFMENVRDICP